MQHRTIAAILLCIGLVATQPPLGLVIWDGLPLGYLFTLGLMFCVIGMAGELKRELRQNAEAEEEISLAP
jgi:hypothetical protein